MDSRQLLQSVVRLVEKPDTRSVERALLRTIKEMVAAESIALCELRADPDAPEKRLAAYTFVSAADDDRRDDAPARGIVALDQDPALQRCADSAEPVIDDRAGEGIRFIYPLAGARDVHALLILHCVTNSARDQELVVMLLAFYKNYVALLEDSQRDKLTGLLNRKTFDDKVLQIIAAEQARSADRPGFCLGVLDIDHFKHVNDTFGHLFGDEVLLLFARCMTEAFRGGDLLFRVGGEEFVVVLKDIDRERSRLVFERFRQLIENFPFPQVGKLTVSIGVSTIGGGDLPATIIDRADRALYCAKNDGRNQIQFYEDLLAAGKLNAAADRADVELF